jgi:hypothetical protein
VAGEVERTLRVVDEVCKKLEEICEDCLKGTWDDYFLYRSCKLIVGASENLHEAKNLIRMHLSYARKQKGNSEWEQLSLF